MQDSCIYQSELEDKSNKCFICKLDEPDNMLEICDCRNKVHLECFKTKYEPKTVITQHGHYNKLTIDDYGCSVCGKRYDSKLTSVRGFRQGSQMHGEVTEQG